MEDNLLTVEEAARSLRLHLDTARRFVREGRLSAIKVGRRYLIPQASIMEFMQQGATDRRDSSAAPKLATLRIDQILKHTNEVKPRSINFEVVDTYHDAMQAGAKFPPIDVFYDGTDYWLADGFHRARAADQADLEEIDCTIHQGTRDDAQWFGFGANKANGMYWSKDDRQESAKTAVHHPRFSQLSDRDIAIQIGLNEETVTKLRADSGKKNKKPAVPKE